MPTIPAKVSSRISEGLKKFQPIVQSAKVRDINESDTVVILTGILSEVLGYDKYTDITTEHAIRGTYCDLAITVDNKLRLLIEAKAIGADLKEAHVKQAVDYAANKGLDWVILTNAHIWRVYKIHFTKPIQNELVAEIDILKLNHKSTDDIELIHILSREGISRSSLEDYHVQRQATNKFLLDNLLLTEVLINAVKKELKQIYPDIRVQADDILNVMSTQVIKRELLEGEDASEAKRKITKALKKKEKAVIEKQQAAAALDQAVSTLSPQPQPEHNNGVTEASE